MRPKRRWLLLVPLLLPLVAWLGVFKVEHLDECEHCQVSRLRHETFWYGVRISSKDFPWAPTTRSQIAVALGRPCPHAAQTTWVRKRVWIGVICANPCHCSITHLTSDWFTPEREDAIAKLAADDPGFADEFVRRVLLADDKEYFKEVAAKIEQEVAKEMPQGSSSP